MGQSLTLIGYSSELYDMAEADVLYPSYNIPHTNCLTPDTVSEFGNRWMIRRHFCQMVRLFVAV